MPAHALHPVRRHLAEDPLGAIGDFLGLPHHEQSPAKRAVTARQVSTVVNVVYYTLPTDSDAETQIESSTTTQRIQRATQDTTQLRPSRTTQASVQAAMVTRDEGIPSQILADPAIGNSIATDAIIAPVITPPSSSEPVPDAIAIAPGGPPPATTHARSSSDRDTAIQGKATETAATAAQSSSSASNSSVSSGMTTGGKVGIAVGAILLAAAALSIIIFCVRKRKRKSGRRAKSEDEKNPFSNAAAIKPTPPAGVVPRPPTKAVVPRLSLRPVTQFLPYGNEKRSSNGIQLAETTPQEQNRNNPFGNHAEAIDPANNANGPSAVQSINAGGVVVNSPTAPSSQFRASVPAPAGTLTRSASKLAPTVDFAAASANHAGPPSPTGTDYSDATDTSFNGAAAAGAMSSGPPGNVHRVQLDFTPQMDDELELRAGQLVRLLHEYDDGWVRAFLINLYSTNICRPCASVSIGLARVSFLAAACLRDQSNLVRSRVVGLRDLLVMHLLVVHRTLRIHRVRIKPLSCRRPPRLLRCHIPELRRRHRVMLARSSHYLNPSGQ